MVPRNIKIKNVGYKGKEYNVWLKGATMGQVSSCFGV